MVLLLKWLQCEFDRIRICCKCSHADEAEDDCKICCGKEFPFGEWEMETPLTPQQNNGYDCGVFVLMLADFIADDLDVTFVKQEKNGDLP